MIEYFNLQPAAARDFGKPFRKHRRRQRITWFVVELPRDVAMLADDAPAVRSPRCGLPRLRIDDNAERCELERIVAGRFILAGVEFCECKPLGERLNHLR